MQRAPEPNGLRGTRRCTSSPLLLRRLTGLPRLPEPAARRALLPRRLAPALRRLTRLLRVAVLLLARLAVPALLRRLPRLREAPARQQQEPAAGRGGPARLAVARRLAVA